ncbi:MAG TPA: metalloregulator ArsR/SmtB family transcription factor [Thermoanaerobaculaceae bacterium]|nr:metalloregulator ArsR/SmtB family transcription factor [Thermoanaerobaculaceae bacterium]
MTSPLTLQVQIHKALAHSARLRVLAMLRGGELCVCQITVVLRLAASTVSAHLAELKAADLVAERKNGRWVHYRLSPTGTGMLRGLWPDLVTDPQIQDDARLLALLDTVAVEAVARPDFDLAGLAARAVRKGCCS